MTYAPILIPTLCRSEHFVRCIESLKKNSWAAFTDVYVALDYPKTQKHMDGYSKIIEYIDNGDFSDFASFNVIKRTENFGSSKNMADLREYIFEKYDRFIRTDDDVEFSSNFLEYMNKCLEFYKDDPNVVAVSGYSYPLNWEISEGSTVFKQSFIAPMWGTGFWREKYQKIKKEITDDLVIVNDFDNQLTAGLKKRVTDLCFAEIFSGQSPNFKAGHSFISRVSDIGLRAYCGMFGYQVILPAISKARNHGFDGTGVCCQKNKSNGKNNSLSYDFSLQPVDVNAKFEIVEDTLNLNNKNMKIFNKFDYRGRLFNLKVNIKLFLYKLLGKKKYSKIIKMLKRQKNH